MEGIKTTEDGEASAIGVHAATSAEVNKSGAADATQAPATASRSGADVSPRPVLASPFSSTSSAPVASDGSRGGGEVSGISFGAGDVSTAAVEGDAPMSGTMRAQWYADRAMKDFFASRAAAFEARAAELRDRLVVAEFLNANLRSVLRDLLAAATVPGGPQPPPMPVLHRAHGFLAQGMEPDLRANLTEVPMELKGVGAGGFAPPAPGPAWRRTSHTDPADGYFVAAKAGTASDDVPGRGDASTLAAAAGKAREGGGPPASATADSNGEGDPLDALKARVQRPSRPVVPAGGSASAALAAAVSGIGGAPASAAAAPKAASPPSTSNDSRRPVTTSARASHASARSADDDSADAALAALAQAAAAPGGGKLVYSNRAVHTDFLGTSMMPQRPPKLKLGALPKHAEKAKRSSKGKPPKSRRMEACQSCGWISNREHGKCRKCGAVDGQPLRPSPEKGMRGVCPRCSFFVGSRATRCQQCGWDFPRMASSPPHASATAEPRDEPAGADALRSRGARPRALSRSVSPQLHSSILDAPRAGNDELSHPGSGSDAPAVLTGALPNGHESATGPPAPRPVVAAEPTHVPAPRQAQREADGAKGEPPTTALISDDDDDEAPGATGVDAHRRRVPVVVPLGQQFGGRLPAKLNVPAVLEASNKKLSLSLCEGLLYKLSRTGHEWRCRWVKASATAVRYYALRNEGGVCRGRVRGCIDLSPDVLVSRPKLVASTPPPRDCDGPHRWHVDTTMFLFLGGLVTGVSNAQDLDAGAVERAKGGGGDSSESPTKRVAPPPPPTPHVINMITPLGIVKFAAPSAEALRTWAAFLTDMVQHNSTSSRVERAAGRVAHFRVRRRLPLTRSTIHAALQRRPSVLQAYANGSSRSPGSSRMETPSTRPDTDSVPSDSDSAASSSSESSLGTSDSERAAVVESRVAATSQTLSVVVCAACNTQQTIHQHMNFCGECGAKFQFRVLGHTNGSGGGSQGGSPPHGGAESAGAGHVATMPAASRGAPVASPPAPGLSASRSTSDLRVVGGLLAAPRGVDAHGAAPGTAAASTEVPFGRAGFDDRASGRPVQLRSFHTRNDFENREASKASMTSSRSEPDLAALAKEPPRPPLREHQEGGIGMPQRREHRSRTDAPPLRRQGVLAGFAARIFGASSVVSGGANGESDSDAEEGSDGDGRRKREKRKKERERKKAADDETTEVSTYRFKRFNKAALDVSRRADEGGGTPTRGRSNSGYVSPTEFTGGTTTWIPDHLASACMFPECKIVFSMAHRRHHCRRCGKVYCDAHSATKRTLESHGYHEPVRICDTCVEVMAKRKGERADRAPATTGDEMVRRPSISREAGSTRLESLTAADDELVPGDVPLAGDADGATAAHAAWHATYGGQYPNTSGAYAGAESQSRSWADEGAHLLGDAVGSEGVYADQRDRSSPPSSRKHHKKDKKKKKKKSKKHRREERGEHGTHAVAESGWSIGGFAEDAPDEVAEMYGSSMMAGDAQPTAGRATGEGGPAPGSWIGGSMPLRGDPSYDYFMANVRAEMRNGH